MVWLEGKRDGQMRLVGNRLMGGTKHIAGLLVCAAFLIGLSGVGAECGQGGAVSGAVELWKAKVRTDGAKNGRDVLVFLEDRNSREFLEADALVSMDQKGLVFIPHALPVMKGTTVRFLNNDNVDHNIYFLYEKTGETLDLGTWGCGISRDYRFLEPGVVITLCKLHLEMAAYIVVFANPYFVPALIDADTQKASFLIENVPPGSYVLNVWHKKLRMKGKPQPITVEAGNTIVRDVVITKAKYAQE
ncbi:hypothetical protein ACFL0Q_06570 [Thermodesulfobacteriota bacterium]